MSLKEPSAETMSDLMNTFAERGYIVEVIRHKGKILTLFNDNSALLADLNGEFHDLAVIDSRTIAIVLIRYHPFEGVAMQLTKPEHDEFMKPRH